MNRIADKLVASIMCGDQLHLQSELDKLTEAGINRLHIDVMDGQFVNNLATGPYIVEALQKNKNFILDVHLATLNPETYIKMFAPLKPDYITFHVEATDNVEEMISLVKSYDIKVGLAYSPDTSNHAIQDFLEDIDLLLVMTVSPGFAGQKFNSNVIEKLEDLSLYIESNHIARPEIEVDGNIHKLTIKRLSHLPIDYYVLGTSALFDGNRRNYREKVQIINEILN